VFLEGIEDGELGYAKRELIRLQALTTGLAWSTGNQGAAKVSPGAVCHPCDLSRRQEVRPMVVVVQQKYYIFTVAAKKKYMNKFPAFKRQRALDPWPEDLEAFIQKIVRDVAGITGVGDPLDGCLWTAAE
jgi:hypothetical protein